MYLICQDGSLEDASNGDLNIYLVKSGDGILQVIGLFSDLQVPLDLIHSLKDQSKAYERMVISHDNTMGVTRLTTGARQDQNSSKSI